MKRVFGLRLPFLPATAVTPAWPGAGIAVLACPLCRAVPAGTADHARSRVCGACGHHDRLSVRETIALLVDPGSFREIDAGLGSTDPLGFTDRMTYRDRLAEHRARTGEVDALVAGTACLDGHAIVLAVLDFSFMGGSMGVVVGEKVARAAERARRQRCPLVTIVASGGARMQEGMLSLLQMAKTTAAVKRLRDAGLPYLSVLTNPTTGGVFASFASLGDVIVAEPKALIGFAGPRVAEQVIGHPLPPGSHTAEFLLDHGMIDAVVDRTRLRAHLAGLLDVFAAAWGGFRAGDEGSGTPRGRYGLPARPSRLSVLPSPSQGRGAGGEGNSSAAGQGANDGSPMTADPWLTVQQARHPNRPTGLDYIVRMLDGFVELRGDRCAGDDPAVVAGLGLLDGHGIAVVAQDREHRRDDERQHGGRAYPEGYRKAQRVMRLAARWRLPLLTLIDTPGAYPGVEAEERGLAGELAASMALMSDLPTPIVAAVIGEGGSGGALALAVADRVLMQAGATYSVIAPEGAASILYRDPSRAAELATKLGLTATELRGLGIVDEVVPEPPGGPRRDPDAAAAELKAAVLRSFAELARRSPKRLVRDRFDRYQRIGRDHAREVRGAGARPAEQPGLPQPVPSGP